MKPFFFGIVVGLFIALVIVVEAKKPSPANPPVGPATPSGTPGTPIYTPTGTPGIQSIPPAPPMEEF